MSKAKYESGASLRAARGHAHTPEHPAEAERKPRKYQDYLNRLSTLRRKAYKNMDGQIGEYIKFNPRNVKDRINGNKDRHDEEGGQGFRGMNRDELKWTMKATEEELIQRATPQYEGNPWWYH